MFWADRIAQEIIKSGKYKPYRVDDMKTPSGRVHVGSLRGVVIHDLLYRALEEQGKKASYTYCINDMDPMDGFPVYLSRAKFEKYMGYPLFKIPSPKEGFSSFSEYFAKEFIGVFNKIGCFPKVIWTSSLYAEGKFDNLIKIYLNNTDKIRHLFKDQYKNFDKEEYYPYQPICPSCGKISTTRIHNWDGKYVSFECKKNNVEYTQGCGYTGQVRPEKQNGKLPWKIEWSAHWKTLGVTIEWSGKDHMTQGGSHEIAAKISEVILDYSTPHAKSYEHILIGGKKMSSSKGLGSSAKEVSDMLPPAILRFLMVRVHYNQTIDFDPKGDAIPSLFDEYDRCAQAYFESKDDLLAKIFVLSQIGKLPKRKLYFPRFKTIISFLRSPKLNIQSKMEENKGGKLTSAEKKILIERIHYARLWLDNYVSREELMNTGGLTPSEVISLTPIQKEYLGKVAKLLETIDDETILQKELYEKARKQNIPVKNAFSAIYLSILGKAFGPKASQLLLSSDKRTVIKRLKEAIV